MRAVSVTSLARVQRRQADLAIREVKSAVSLERKGDVPGAAKAMDLAWPHVVQALSWCLHEGVPSEDRDRCLVTLVLVAHAHLALRQSPADHTLTLHEALGGASRLGDEASAIRIEAVRVGALTRAGSFKDGLHKARRLLRRARLRKDVALTTLAAGALVSSLSGLGRSRLALLAARGRVALLRTGRDRVGLAEALSDLGGVLDDLGEREQAAVVLDEALVLARQRKLVRVQADVTNTLGILHKYAGRLDRALELYAEQLRLGRLLRDHERQATALNNMGLAFVELRRFDDARECFHEALRLRQAIGNVQGIGRLHGCLGIVAKHLEEYDVALAEYGAWIQICRATGDMRSESQAVGNQANVVRRLGRHDEAIALYHEALRLDWLVGDVHSEAIDHYNLGVAYEEAGRLQEAELAYRTTIPLLARVGHARGEVLARMQLRGVLLGRGDDELLPPSSSGS